LRIGFSAFFSGQTSANEEEFVMKKQITSLAVLLLAGSSLTLAQRQEQGTVIVPDSTLEYASDIGVRAHTNHLILAKPGTTGTSPSGEIPQSLACVYSTSSTTLSTNPGCKISDTTLKLPSGGSGIIAIVDAYDYPTAQSDFDTFSKQFGLPLSTDNVCGSGTEPCFQKVIASGSPPHANSCWDLEAALDIEWAHAMAPHAQIVLVEAASNSFSNLFAAVDKATEVVQSGSTGKGEVSMSWGGSEFSSESSDDSHFTQNGVVYFGASGDTGGVTIYPSASPDVLAAGGTSIGRDRYGNFTGETGWSGSGGGPSLYELQPNYQISYLNVSTGGQRGVPDFSFDADPSSGVSIYDSSKPCQGFSGWIKVGGTSVASPSLAGIVNLAGHFASSTDAELDSLIYNAYDNDTGTNYTSDFRDIVSGSAGSNSAGRGWDFVTGVGSNLGLNGK
jgi:kumamolisin